MNSAFTRWLLDLETIPADATGLRLGWQHPLPAWVWAIVIVLAALLAWWSYTRLQGSRRIRAVLGGARALLLVLLVVLLAGPQVVLPQEQIEPDWVLVLADRSSSMGIADGAVEGGARTTRDEQLQAALRDNAAMWAELGESKRVVWLGFHNGAFDLALDDEDGLILGDADGWRTRLGTAVDQALQRAAARPISGIVVLSDGRTNDPPSRTLLRKLQAEAANVYTVPLGSEDALGDLAIRRVVAPDRAFVRDVVPVTVEVDRLGDAGDQIDAVARLIDERTGAELDRVVVPAGSGNVTLTGRTEDAGDVSWQVVVEPDSPDLVAENNARSVRLEFIDRPLRVLFVEGYPRWEYRFVKNLLVREKSIESSVMLLSADRDFAQEGNAPITRLPNTADEFGAYDLIIIGDVPAGFFTPEQLALMRGAVADRGTGLLWIGGPISTPRSWSNTVLADLLPIRGSLEVGSIGEPVNMVPTPLATRLGVLQLNADDRSGWPDELADSSFGWSSLQYAQRIEPGQLKPTAEVLAQTTEALSGGALPLVIAMRYGAGQIVYVATDEIWRWRYGRGELLPEQFWVQMVRLLGRERLAGGEPATLQVEPRPATPGQPVRVSLRLLDERLADPDRASVAAVVETAEGRRLAEIVLLAADGDGQEFVATWVPDVDAASAGELVVRIDDPTVIALDVRELRSGVTVVRPDDERRQPETDHALLTSLSAETGGQVLPVERLGELKDLLRNRAVRTENPIRESIWNTPLAFALILLLLTAEWIGRKLIRLV